MPAYRLRVSAGGIPGALAGPLPRSHGAAVVSGAGPRTTGSTLTQVTGTDQFLPVVGPWLQRLAGCWPDGPSVPACGVPWGGCFPQPSRGQPRETGLQST